MTATRYPSVPLADDPELAEHALWNDEIAADLEDQALWFEANRPYEDLPDIDFYPHGAVVTRARTASAELRKLAERTVEQAAVYRGAVKDLSDGGMSYAQIAAALGISRGSVQGHVERARREAGEGGTDEQ